MTTENKSKRSFAKIIIGLVVLFVIILAMGVWVYLKNLEDALIVDNKWSTARFEVQDICKAEQDYKSKTGNFTNDFANLIKDFGGKGNIKETDFIVITLDEPIIHISDRKEPDKKISFNMDKCGIIESTL